MVELLIYFQGGLLMNYIQTQKFSDVYVSCKTMMPFHRNTISALNVLVYMMKAKTQKMNSKQKLASTLNRAYGTKVSYGLTSYGDLVQLDVRFQFVRPDWIVKGMNSASVYLVINCLKWLSIGGLILVGIVILQWLFGLVRIILESDRFVHNL